MLPFYMEGRGKNAFPYKTYNDKDEIKCGIEHYLGWKAII